MHHLVKPCVIAAASLLVGCALQTGSGEPGTDGVGPADENVSTQAVPGHEQHSSEDPGNPMGSNGQGQNVYPWPSPWHFPTAGEDSTSTMTRNTGDSPFQDYEASQGQPSAKGAGPNGQIIVIRPGRPLPGINSADGTPPQ
jgi:hypothetical protein